MWVLIFLFGLSCVVIGWTCFGYYICLRFQTLLRPRAAAPVDCEDLPFVSVVVPCYNERDQIVAKYINLREQDYPKERLEIVFADGGSTDGTPELLAAQAKDDPAVRVVSCPQKGKIYQLNHVLPQLRGSIVVNTDVDGQMELDTVSALVREFYRDERVAVVGAYTYPAKPLEVDRCYWAGQNRGRLLESDVCATSIVIAVCYAFRRDLFAAFPADVVADDIYVAFEANTRGLRSVYCREAVVSEVRGPSTLEQFFAHKFRKSNAYLREALRFLYRVPDMPKGWKVIYCTKLAQLLLLPWAGVWLLMLGASLLTLGRYDVVLIGLAFLVLLLILTSATFRRIPLPEGGEDADFLTMLVTYVYSSLLLLATGLSYPFYRQTSSYAKVGRESGEQDKGEPRA
ncbi:MAG TPA: glycosyltransferase [Planctomycetota bacterium]|nr:glycosyltransferase [Planctomycetota bacterium]